ncbi:MAG TPA: zinc-binding dehydrogenase [Candidatus Dormibacteraeota bacterium]|nr:zinc-binding dehydrogenase [Candidatus Dormibacteraeota bacterium]
MVLATASEESRDYLQGLGAAEIIDYHMADFGERAGELDIVLDTVGGGYGQRSIPCLKPAGRLITVLERADEDLKARTLAAGRRLAGVTVEPVHAGLEELAKLVIDGRLEPNVDATFPLERAAAAHERMEAGHTRGKIVLRVS